MNSRFRSIIKSLRNNELVWRYGYNFSPSLSYALRGTEKLSNVERSILENLNRDGIAITSMDELFPNGPEFPELCLTVDSMLQDRQREISELESKAADTNQIGNKTFNMEVLGSKLTFEPENIFARIALNAGVLNIANAYFRMRARLRYYNVWYTFASPASARESQLWHFDREDNYILKAFMYLRDVDEGTGPFTYAPGTHRKGRMRNRQPEAFDENGVSRSNDEQMSAVVPKEKWITAVGKKGTIVFADTRGYHKGGEARTSNRLMYTCMFTSPASDSKELMDYPRSNYLDLLTEKQRLAIDI